jgi:hypothetical protein
MMQVLSFCPRHDHPLQPRLRIVAARAIVEDGDPKPCVTHNAPGY